MIDSVYGRDATSVNSTGSSSPSTPQPVAAVRLAGEQSPPWVDFDLEVLAQGVDPQAGGERGGHGLTE